MQAGHHRQAGKGPSVQRKGRVSVSYLIENFYQMALAMQPCATCALLAHLRHRSELSLPTPTLLAIIPPSSGCTHCTRPQHSQSAMTLNGDYGLGDPQCPGTLCLWACRRVSLTLTPRSLPLQRFGDLLIHAQWPSKALHGTL